MRISDWSSDVCSSDLILSKDKTKAMKTVETLNEGLKREYRVTITAKDIDARVDDEVKSIAPTVRMPGFRPGKVPPNLIRKMHGPTLSADALNKAIDRSEEHTSELQSLMRISYAVFCLKNKNV